MSAASAETVPVDDKGSALPEPRMVPDKGLVLFMKSSTTSNGLQER